MAVYLPGEPARYEPAGKGHHHHFRCRGCDRLFEVTGCRPAAAARPPRGFRDRVARGGLVRPLRGLRERGLRRSLPARGAHEKLLSFRCSSARRPGRCLLAAAAAVSVPAPSLSAEHRGLDLPPLRHRAAGRRATASRWRSCFPRAARTHDYDPSPRTWRVFRRCELVFGGGAGPRLLARARPRRAPAAGGRRVFELGPLVDPAARARSGGSIDPHFLLDPDAHGHAPPAPSCKPCRTAIPEGTGRATPRAATPEGRRRSFTGPRRRRSASMAGFRKRAIVTFHGSFYYFAGPLRPRGRGGGRARPGREPTAREMAEVLVAIARQTERRWPSSPSRSSIRKPAG